MMPPAATALLTKITPVNRIPIGAVAGLTVALALLSSCQRREEDPPPAGAGGGASPSFVSDRPAYRETMPASWGRVRGSLDVDGGHTADTIVLPTHDQKTCGDTLSFRTLEYDAGVVGSVVWLEDVRTGKAMPLERRYELLYERCLITPRTQAVVTGGTLNVRSLDDAGHRLRLVVAPGVRPQSIISLHTAGQVVPVQNLLRKPARIALTCDRHPWTHGWVLVFDHPYYAETHAGGSFLMDSVPPGNYRLVAWHNRFGSVEQPVTVTANAETKASLKFVVVTK